MPHPRFPAPAFAGHTGPHGADLLKLCMWRAREGRRGPSGLWSSQCPSGGLGEFLGEALPQELMGTCARARSAPPGPWLGLGHGPCAVPLLWPSPS